MAMAADGRGWPWSFAAVGRPRELPWQLPRTSADFRGDCRDAQGRGNCHGRFRENCRGDCRGLPWVAMVGSTDVATDRTAARAVATTMVFAVEVP